MPKKDGFKNLIPAKKGEVRNPKGRTPGKSISSYLKSLLEGTIKLKDETGKEKNFTRAEAIALKLFQKAMSGKATDQAQLKAIEQILDRTEGKPLQATINENTGDLNIRIIRE